MGAKSKAVAISDIVQDDRCQVRADIQGEAVDDYAARYAADSKSLPPVEVFEVVGKLYLVDGFHRIAAAAQAGVGFIRCTTVGKGSVADAAWYATSVNQGHGIRRTNADKRRAVRLALESEIGSEQSTVDIAEHVGVSRDLVSRVREEVEGTRSGKVKGKDGKWYPKRLNQGADSTPCEPNPAESHDTENGSTALAEPEKKETPPKSDPFREAAKLIKRCRAEVKALLNHQTIDMSLEDAWRQADDGIVVKCSQCDGEGCKWCEGGQTTKAKNREVKEKVRSLQRGREARGLA